MTAVAFATLKHPSAMLAELLHLIIVSLGCFALCVAFNSRDRTRTAFSAFGVFALGFLSLRACPELLGSWLFGILKPEFAADDPFAPEYIIVRTTQAWFAVFAAFLASIVTPWVVALVRTRG
jgi:hypothetical protein